MQDAYLTNRTQWIASQQTPWFEMWDIAAWWLLASVAVAVLVLC